MGTLLMHYIKLAISEARDARVPQQLVSKEDEGSRDEGEAAQVSEFSVVGSIAGYTAPLGMDPDKLGRKKNASRKKRK